MMDAMEEALTAVGVPFRQVSTERFDMVLREATLRQAWATRLVIILGALLLLASLLFALAQT